MAARSVENYQAIRGANSFYNQSLLINQCKIVQYAFNGMNPLYGTASHLYHSLYRPVNPDRTYLFRIARRCDIAKQLAVALAAQLQNAGTRFDEVSYGKFTRNVVPYLLAHTHFFECCRDGLANYVPDPSHPNSLMKPSARVEMSILAGRYNRETVYRICALHRMLKRIIAMYYWLLDVRGVDFIDCTEFFTFGGLEAVKDAFLGPGLDHRVSIVDRHFVRASPNPFARPHALLPSTFSRVDRATAAKICRLLPDPQHPVLEVENLWLCGFPLSERCQTEREVARFHEYLVTYEGDEPELVL